jgi:hypothetical protein
MYNFKITFERSNGTKGSDIFTENTKQEAIQAFKACYRHDTYKILSVEIDKTQELEFVHMLQTEGYDDYEIEQIIDEQ